MAAVRSLGPVRSVEMVARQVRWEQKQFWRNPAAAAFTFAFPIMFLVIFMAINGGNQVSVSNGRVHFAQYYVPAIIAFGLISACYTNLAFTLSINRENGILKRLRGTPLAPGAYMSGVVSSVIVIALILTLLTTAMGLLFYHVTFPNRYLGLVVTVAAAGFCFSALGTAVSTFVPNEDAAPAIINFILFPLLFISGTFGSIKNSSVLAQIANIFPIRHLILLLVAVFNPRISGSGISLTNLGMLLLWGVIGIVISLRRFRWEPRHT
jgi:ABC-2 type transport system permease protein